MRNFFDFDMVPLGTEGLDITGDMSLSRSADMEELDI